MNSLRKTIRSSALLGLAFSTCLASTANGTVIYTGPTTYIINTTVGDNIVVDNSAAVLNVQSGGVVQGVNDPLLLGAVRTQSGTLNVSGNGRIEAGVDQVAAISMRGSRATVRLSDQAVVMGDIVNEFEFGWRGENAAVRLFMEDQAEVNGNLRYGGYLRLQDQARINGNIINGGYNGTHLDMRGGEVTGEVAFGGANDYVFDMSGGAILGGFRGGGGSVEMTMSDGYIGNGFRTRDGVRGTISGGKIDGGISLNIYTDGSLLNVTGGRFDTVAGDYLYSSWTDWDRTSLRSSLNILGGQWGYGEAGLGFFLDDSSSLSVTGWDLTFVDGLLSGYLLDGNWFSNQFTFGSDWSGTFTINIVPHNVPEPGTLGLMLASAAGMIFARRRQVVATS